MINVFVSPELSAQAPLRHGFFGRRGGVSHGLFDSLNCGLDKGDLADNVAQNRARALGALHHEPFSLCLNKQVHGTTVITIDKAPPTPLEGDGMVTATRGLALGILTADCVPVLFYCPHSHVIGACHAGWKGAIGGVTDAVIGSMMDLGAKTDQIIAAVGPCIAQESYEVDAAFRETFLHESPHHGAFFAQGAAPEKFQFDIRAYVHARLNAHGLHNITHVSHDTCAREADFFSFRRTTLRGEKHFGTQISMIALL